MENPQIQPQEDSIFSEGTRQYYAEEIRKGATKALIFGILSIFCCPPIFAYLGFTTAQEVLTNIDIYEVEHTKRGMAQAAKVLAIVGIALWGVGIVLRLAGAAVTR